MTLHEHHIDTSLPPEVEERIENIAAKPHTPRLIWWIVLAVTMVTLITATIVVISVQHHDASNASSTASCVSKINGQYNAVRDKATALNRQVSREFYTLYFSSNATGQPVSTVIVAQFNTLESQALAADQEVAALPSLTEAIHTHCGG